IVLHGPRLETLFLRYLDEYLERRSDRSSLVARKLRRWRWFPRENGLLKLTRNLASPRNIWFVLKRWYVKNGRNFQFRTTRDPYRILVCEILLRQTTAKQVDSLYQDMFAKYPNVSSLAQASEKELRKTIKSIG